MGHPRKRRKTYIKPSHPWERDRIEKEKVLVKEYGFKNKKEIWKTQSILRKYTKQAKNLLNLTTLQAEKEKKQLLDKLFKLNLLPKNAKIGDVLNLTVNDIANRRLQTLVLKKELARSINQARQFITHGHVLIGENKITVPSYLVNINEENIIDFDKSSGLSNKEHPERIVKEKPKKELKKEKVVKKEKVKKTKKVKPKKKEVKVKPKKKLKKNAKK